MINTERRERPDEKDAIEAIIRLYSKGFRKKQYEPNERSLSPDYLLEYDLKSVLVEIINSNDFRIKAMDSGELTVEKRPLVVEGIKELETEIYKFAKKFLKFNESIILTLNISLLCERFKIRKIAQMILVVLEEKYKNNLLVPDIKVSLDLKEVPLLEVSAILTTYYFENPSIRIIPIDPLESNFLAVEASLEAQAKFILMSAVNEKKTKITAVKPEDWKVDPELEKWLTIINRNPFLIIDNFICAYEELCKENLLNRYFFNKIFIIDNHNAYDLSDDL